MEFFISSIFLVSHVAAWVSASTDVGVVLGGVVASDVDVILGHEILEALIQVLSVGDHLVLGLGVIRNVHVVCAWCLDLKQNFC